MSTPSADAPKGLIVMFWSCFSVVLMICFYCHLICFYLILTMRDWDYYLNNINYYPHYDILYNIHHISVSRHQRGFFFEGMGCKHHFKHDLEADQWTVHIGSEHTHQRVLFFEGMGHKCHFKHDLEVDQWTVHIRSEHTPKGSLF